MSDWTLPPPEEEVLWRGRSLVPPADYEITTLRAVARFGVRRRAVRELPLAGLTSATVLRRRFWYYPLALADLTIRCGDDSLTLRAIRRVDEALEALRAIERERGLALAPAYEGDESEIFVVGSEGARPARVVELAPSLGIRAFGPVILMMAALVALFAYGSIRRRTVNYPADDAIYPRGVKRSHKEIIRFMEIEVLPFARVALGPVVGGEENVTCETCHGRNPDARGWRMPAVRALPDPNVLSRISDSVRRSDALVQTAVYGYLATEENQKKMRWMREVVLPGMAKVLRRPAYDFTQPYEYNRQRFAFGCYHCHQLDRRDGASVQAKR